MAFVKAAWKILVAVKDGLVLLFLLGFFVLLYMLLTLQPEAGRVGDGALLLELDGVVVEEASQPDPLDWLLPGGEAIPEYAARDLVHAIDRARTDSRINSLVLDLDFFLGGGQVNLDDVAAAIDRFKQSDKPVYAFATFYTDDSYQLAAHADEVWVDPMGGIALSGRGGKNLYYADLLDRLGVTAHIYRVGTYKSAVEPYMLSGPSPAATEASRELYGELWQYWLTAVQKARPKADLVAFAEQPAQLAEQARGDLAKLALDSGLADKVGNRLEFNAHVAEQAGDSDEEATMFANSRYADWLTANPRAEGGDAIGVLTVSGEIVGGDGTPGMAASGPLTDLIYTGLEEEQFKALVVRIDSPGGSALASEEIRQAIQAVRDADIPVVVSMGDVAASGGYWIATEADTIFAEPDTITGSIGVFAVLPSFEGLLREWGVNSEGVSTTPLSGQPDFAGGFNDEFNRIAQVGVEHSYRQFTTLVAEARGMDVERVDAIGQGRVWDGGTARQLGLVDRLGNMEAAMKEAAKLAKLDSYHPVFMRQPSTYPTWLLGDGTAQTRQRVSHERGLVAWAAREQRQLVGQFTGSLERLASGRDVQALCLECTAASAPPARQPRWTDLAMTLLAGK